MKNYSRAALAKTAVNLLTKHSQKEVIGALAEALVAKKAGNDAEILVQEIGRQMLEKEGVLNGSLACSRPLNETSRNKITELFKRLTGAKRVNLQETTDEKIIGGFRVVTPVVEMDASVSRTLYQLIKA